MYFPSFKWILFFVVFISIYYVNKRFEIFALNIPKVKVINKAEGCFRVMTYNIYGNENFIDDIELFKVRLIKEIEKQDPDILCLQEISPSILKKIHSSIDSIFDNEDSKVFNNGLSEVGVFSKKPYRHLKIYKGIKDIDTIGFDNLQKIEVKHLKNKMPFFSVEIEVEDDRWITLYSCHLRSSAYSVARRSMGNDTSWFNGIPLYIKNYKIGERIRNTEVDNLKIYLDSLDLYSSPMIIAGDFNDWSGSYCIETLKNGILKDAWWEGGLGFGVTYDAWHLKLRLDHILYSPHFELLGVHVKKSGLSDHYPLIADFRFKSDF